MFISVSDGFQKLHPDDVDCGTNEDLFLAIAAMTDCEYDIHRYYMVTESFGQYKKGKIYPNLPLASDIHPGCYRKATVQELVEHFKSKEETR